MLVACGLVALATSSPMPASSSAQVAPIRILVIGAHPDDADSCAGGTAILWASMVHRVKFLSLTNGDAGHQSQGGGALAKRRRAEAEEAGRRFGIVEYEVLDNQYELHVFASP